MGPDTHTEKWHTYSNERVARFVRANPQTGLSQADAATRLKEHGYNRLSEAPPPSPWRLFLRQFTSFLIVVLLAAAALAAGIGNYKDAVIIVAVVLLNASLGFYQEFRAEQSLTVLKKMLPRKARVRRDGHLHEVLAERLVPGDLVHLEAGDRVPADGRLYFAAGLEIDESALTGESQSVAKQADTTVGLKAPLGDRVNMAYMHSLVTRGRGELVVVATGMQTEIGRLSAELGQTEVRTSPLQAQLDKLAQRLAILAVFLVGTLFIIELSRGQTFIHVLLDSIALLVAAMPEGLPAVVTVTLALGMRRMARERAIVKKLASVETLGCATVICSDKTGTLTLNQMTVRALFYGGCRFEVTGEGYDARGEIHSSGHLPIDLDKLLWPAALCNDSRLTDGQLIGDPTEGALLVLAKKGGVDLGRIGSLLPRIAEIPFDSKHKFMATFHRDKSVVRIYVKGAPDVLLAHCNRHIAQTGLTSLNKESLSIVESEYRRLAEQGLRGLLIAERDVPLTDFDPRKNLFDYVTDLTLLGVVGIMDPPRPEARQAIALCRQAGIQVKMITGDHRDTAVAIARDLGIEGEVITGTELDGLSAHQLAERIEQTGVFARVAPEHKVKIVRALQERGHVVAMTGDGVNDAPALKNADIGVAMGITGTEVSKEAAAVVLTDDNFASIVRAVREGRTLYDNIVKFVRFQLSTTTGAVMTVFFAPLLGLPEPFNPVRILWVAIIMDGPPAVALALDSARPGIMHESPRDPKAQILTWRRAAKVLAFGMTMTVGTLGVLAYGVATTTADRAITLAFTTFVLFQFFNVFNARAERGTAFNRSFFNNRMLWVSLLAVLVLQFVAVQWPPARTIFAITDLGTREWLIALAVASSILFLEEGRKLVARIWRRI